jgi:hypothetical protein
MEDCSTELTASRATMYDTNNPAQKFLSGIISVWLILLPITC